MHTLTHISYASFARENTPTRTHTSVSIKAAKDFARPNIYLQVLLASDILRILGMRLQIYSSCSNPSTLPETCIYSSEKQVWSQSFNTETPTSKVRATQWGCSPDYFNRLMTFETHHVSLKPMLKETVHRDCLPTFSLKKFGHLNLLFLKFQSIPPCALSQVGDSWPESGNQLFNSVLMMRWGSSFLGDQLLQFER